MNIILVILVLSLIVFFHELGHFIMAKINHVNVLEFAIGMGPAIFKTEKKGTKYAIRILPIGGYCLMQGEDEESDDENSFNNKPIWVRALVLFAGSGFNFILAFILGVFLIHFTGRDPAILRDVVEKAPAWEAGIRPGDTIVEINDSKIYNYRELLLHMQINNEAKPITFLMETSDGTRYEAVVTPEIDESGNYKLGVMGGYEESPNILSDLEYGALELRYWVKATVTSLRMIFTGGVSGDDLMGPVGIGNAMGDVIDEVKEISTTTKETIINIILNLMNWSILISVNLAVMNLLPIPALDGGRLFFLLIEAIRRKKIPQEKEALVNMIGFVILIGIMLLVFFNDIKNVFF